MENDNNKTSTKPWYEMAREDRQEREENRSQTPKDTKGSCTGGAFSSMLTSKTRGTKAFLLSTFSAFYPREEGFRVRARVNTKAVRNDFGLCLYDDKLNRYIRYNIILVCHVYISHKLGKSSMQIDFDYNLRDSRDLGAKYDSDFQDRVVQTAIDRKPWIIRNLRIR